ncbi:fumarylacetoacetate hydrolase family protein [Lichenicoccus sp.]|uniref:fumarylacetoacetate hydrolase family protein n=1 Tax=Lichenicoccus sp. TaxID=2781899 RepID=UPI003D0F1549
MKLVTFSVREDTPRVGLLAGDEIVDLTAAGVARSMRELIESGARALSRARDVVDLASRLPLASVRLLAPVPDPSKVLCCGINYRAHAAENPDATMPGEPFFFAKLASSVVGHEAPIPYPPRTAQLDYEVEFAAVIGTRLTRADEREVMPALFGYTLLNDISARDVQFKDNQITLGKNFDAFAPIGPCIVTADALDRPDAVRLQTRLNGRVMQDGSTSDWLFSLPRLIASLSHVMTLHPGDIVTTGTPAGVGFFQRPQIFMCPGDVIEIEAEMIGTLRNTIIA